MSASAPRTSGATSKSGACCTFLLACHSSGRLGMGLGESLLNYCSKFGRCSGCIEHDNYGAITLPTTSNLPLSGILATLSPGPRSGALKSRSSLGKTPSILPMPCGYVAGWVKSVPEWPGPLYATQRTLVAMFFIQMLLSQCHSPRFLPVPLGQRPAGSIRSGLVGGHDEDWRWRASPRPERRLFHHSQGAWLAGEWEREGGKWRKRVKGGCIGWGHRGFCRLV